MVMCFLRLELKTGRNFEAVQSYLGLFLKMHGEAVAEEEVIHLWQKLCFQPDYLSVPGADARAGNG